MDFGRGHAMAMSKDLEWHSYAFPALGRHRHWKLIANDNPADNHARGKLPNPWLTES